MRDWYLGQIEPWNDQNNQQTQTFKQRLKTASGYHKPTQLKKLHQTEVNIFRKLKTEESSVGFRKRKFNQANIITLDFEKRQQISRSNLRQVMLGSKREQLLTASKKKSLKGVSIRSMKKRLIDLKIVPEHPYSSPALSIKHLRNKNFSEHKINSNVKISRQNTSKTHEQSIESKSHSLNISRINFQKAQVGQGKDFFNEVAVLWKHKMKLMNLRQKQVQKKNSFNSQNRLERQLFMRRNRKFKSWQKLNLRVTSIPVNSQLYSTIL